MIARLLRLFGPRHDAPVVVTEVRVVKAGLDICKRTGRPQRLRLLVDDGSLDGGERVLVVPVMTAERVE